MPVVNANGVDLHTMLLGDRGPLLVMMHGLVAGSIATWCFQFAPAIASHYRVLLYDMRGHGKSAMPGDGYDVATMAEDLRALLAIYQCELGQTGESVYLVGHSYGALTALQYAVDRERLGGPAVEAMVLVDAPLPASRFVYPGMEAIVSEQRAGEVARAFAAQLGIAEGRRRRKLVEHVTGLYLNTTMCQDVANSGDIDNSVLATLPTRTLLLYGERSECLSAGKRLAAMLPNNEYMELPSGHYITVEAPTLLQQQLHDFLGVSHG